MDNPIETENRKRLLAELAGRPVLASPDRTLRVAIDGIDGLERLHSPMNSVPSSPLWAARSFAHRWTVFTIAGLSDIGKGGIPRRDFSKTPTNYTALKKYLLDPLSPGGSHRYRRACFDHVTDRAVSVVKADAPPFSILLLDGIFLHRSELLAYWDVSIFLRTDFAVSVARCAARDGSSADPAAPSNRRYVEGQRLYLQSCQPEARATIVIDYNDLRSPTIVKPSRL